MKKVMLAAISVVAMLVVSCSNDEITVVKDDKVNDVNVSVSLSNFFSSYNFNDTKHDIQVTDAYRVFNSENGDFIQARTMFYDSNGDLVDSIVVYSTNTNSFVRSIQLAEGNYTAVSTLLFAYKSKNKYYTLWTLSGRETLSTAVLLCDNRWSKWSIMSYDSQNFTVRKGQTTEIAMTPKPVGALCYLYFQNFQYLNQYSTSSAADNGIRSLCLYGRNVAKGYRLNPAATERFVYLNDGGSNYWYFLSDKMVPSDFDDSWTYFKSNLYDYCHILAPQANVQFGYVSEGKSTFSGYGEATYDIVNGQTYLAYWDYFQVGNPYFGLADNSHWHTYNVKAPVSSFMARKTDSQSKILRPFMGQ